MKVNILKSIRKRYSWRFGNYGFVIVCDHAKKQTLCTSVQGFISNYLINNYGLIADLERDKKIAVRIARCKYYKEKRLCNG